MNLKKRIEQMESNHGGLTGKELNTIATVEAKRRLREDGESQPPDPEKVEELAAQIRDEIAGYLKTPPGQVAGRMDRILTAKRGE